MSIRRLSCTLLCAGLLVAAGCVWFEEDPKRMDLGMEAGTNPYANSAAFRDTVGAYGFFQGLAPMRVRGFGLVVGLGKNGSSDCPKPIFDQLVQALYKHHRFRSTLVGTRSLSPEQLIEDPDTAVVLVRGVIPPAATRGLHFDISVMAVPGSETKSLRGGRLYTTELEMFREKGPSETISGRILARGAGPVFLNPFAGGDAATRTNELEGVIIGGGIVDEPRRVRFVLSDASYQRVRQIRDRINDFAGGDFVAADATSPSYVQLRIPPEYAEEPAHWLQVVRSLYLRGNPRFEAVRARELADELTHPAAAHARITHCFEGLGPDALPAIEPLYEHPRDYASFHAAVAGMRLGDHLAVDVLIHHAEDAAGKFRDKAILALGRARGNAAAGMCLRRLLSDEDARIRVAACEQLVERSDPTVVSTVVGGDNFSLDVVPSEAAPFVHVKRQQDRRVALFGNLPPIQTPVLYRSPNGSLTMTARDGDDSLTVIRTVLATGSTSPPVQVPRDVAEMVKLLGDEPDLDFEGNVTGLGVEYGEVARLLYHLTEEGALRCNFVLEQPGDTDLFDTTRREGRPESEL